MIANPQDFHIMYGGKAGEGSYRPWLGDRWTGTGEGAEKKD